jgi:hypothetical protein
MWLRLLDGKEKNFHYSVAAKLLKQGKATPIDNEVEPIEEVKPKKEAKQKKVKKANG